MNFIKNRRIKNIPKKRKGKKGKIKLPISTLDTTLPSDKIYDTVIKLYPVMNLNSSTKDSIKGIKFHYVKTMIQVLELALT